MKKIGVMLICVLIGLEAAAAANEPLDAIRKPIDQVIAILNDPSYEAAGRKAAQRDKLWEVIQPVFNFDEISRRTLAADWRLLSPEQQKEFVTVFSEFLGHTYLDKVQGEYNNEEVLYLSQEMLPKSRALIKTKIMRGNNIEVPVDYRMQQDSQGWRIYDVHIEGVSLVQNYRSQFREILMKESPARLIDRLKKKREEQKKK